MKIAVVLNVHGDTKLVLDTLDSIRTWVSEDVLVVIDGAKWDNWGESLNIPAYKLKGFTQRTSRSPYRNVALGLQQAYKIWDDVDWLCYVEYDTLFTSDRFLKNLEVAQEKNVWMLGNDGRVDNFTIPWLEHLVGKMKNSYYLLGCCQFFSKSFLLKLKEIDFFEKFLNISGNFSANIPGYSGYDISEHIYPTMARHFGGNIGVFASWNGKEWRGSYEVFPMRWKPEIEEDFENSSIIHPLKTYDHFLRVIHRKRRDEIEVNRKSCCQSAVIV